MRVWVTIKLFALYGFLSACSYYIDETTTTLITAKPLKFGNDDNDTTEIPQITTNATKPFRPSKKLYENVFWLPSTKNIRNNAMHEKMDSLIDTNNTFYTSLPTYEMGNILVLPPESLTYEFNDEDDNLKTAEETSDEKIEDQRLSESVVYGKPLELFDDTQIEDDDHNLDLLDLVNNDKKKQKEVHYHKHKHLHDHEHNQEHQHKHRQEHTHSHSHGHKHDSQNDHHHQDHHEHHHKGKHHHIHEGNHQHDHHGSHHHDYNDEHKHEHQHHDVHMHNENHGHDHDHLETHNHQHHSSHRHGHKHGHSHQGKHYHNHHSEGKHTHHHEHDGHHHHSKPSSGKSRQRRQRRQRQKIIVKKHQHPEDDL